MTTKLKRILGGLLTTAVAASVPLISASPAGAAPTLEGAATVKTAGGAADLMAGDANDVWTLRLPAGAACTSDGNNGGRAHTYMIPASEDPATDLAFNGSGSLVGASLGTGGSGSFRNNLYNGTNPARNVSLNLGDAAIINIPNFAYTVFTAGQIPSGAYDIGIACVDLDEANAINRFWNQTITVTYPGGDAAGAQISWVVGAVPEVPTNVVATPGDSSLSVAFTPGASNPETTQFTVTATPTAGGIPVTATGTASPITVPGLANGTEYSVTVRATNTAGDSAESNAVTGTPNPGARPAVQNLAFTQGAPGSGTGTLSWSAPTGDVPTGYDVTASPAGPTIGAVAGTTASVSGMAENVAYTFTVTPLHPAPYVGTPAQVSATALPAAVVYQQLDVTVPEGVLTITQACGTGPVGCEVQFGTATLITSGTGAGQFYKAAADLHPITLTDTRDTDPGWTATGTMGAFSAAVGETFSGDQLGWTPAAVGTGGFATATGTYTQTVTPGAPVAPNTAGGLGAGATLATGALGGGLGIFTLDASVDLLIPVGQADGDYSGVLTITAS